MRQIGKIGLINYEANKRLEKKYEEKEIIVCEAGLPGCLVLRFLSFHHRYRRIEYRDRDRQKHIENLSDYWDTLLVCAKCHEKLIPGDELSEQLFEKKLEKKS